MWDTPLQRTALPLMGAIALAIHTCAYLATTALVAQVVYRKLGLAILRTAWLNMDAMWAGALLITGLFVLLNRLTRPKAMLRLRLNVVHLADFRIGTSKPPLHDLEQHHRLRLVHLEKHRGMHDGHRSGPCAGRPWCHGAGRLRLGTTASSRARRAHESSARSREIVAVPDTETHSRVRSL